MYLHSLRFFLNDYVTVHIHLKILQLKTYFHKRKSSYAQLYSATNKNAGENTIDVVAEIITINY